MLLLLLSLLFLSPSALAAPVAEGRSPEVDASDDCKKCAGTGLVACKDCAKRGCLPREPEPAAPVARCSAAEACCAGLRSVPCSRCDGPPESVLAVRAEQSASFAAWARARAEAVEGIGEEVHHLESAHFRLDYGIRRLKLKGASKSHQVAHVYARRLEELFALFVADLAADPAEDVSHRTHVLLWDNAHDQELASLRFTKQPSTTMSKLMGAEPVVSIHYDKSHLHEEFELHQAVVHQVAHCLLSNVYDGVWPGNIKGGWLDAGLAHAYEVELFDGVRNYCYVESDTLLRFKFGTWEPSVRKAVDADEAPGFLGIAQRHTTDLTPEEHMFAWSYVDFLRRAHPGKLGPLARLVKRKTPIKDALQEVLGLNPFAFEAAWKEFVRAEYELKKKRR